MYTVYIIRSPSTGRCYAGFTSNLRKRIKQHRNGQTQSISYADDWMVVWKCRIETTGEARELEKSIKARGIHRFLSEVEE